MDLRIVIVAAALLLTAAGASAADGQANEQLVRRYIASRPEVFSMIDQVGMPVTPTAPEQLAEVAAAMTKALRPSPDWNSSHPDWARMQQTIAADLPKFVEELSASPQFKQARDAFSNAVVSGIASQLSDEQVRQLAQHYAQPEALQFATVEAYMQKQADQALAQVQMMAAAGKPFPSPAEQNAKEQAVLVSLMRERLALQLGMVDPGPQADRSGLQALPIMMGAAVSFNFDKIEAAWMTISAAQRSAILAWRDSALAKAELEAIYEAGKSLGALPELQAQTARMEGTLIKYHEKWRAQLDDAGAGR